MKMPPTVTGRANFPPYSNEGSTRPITAAASITPAAKERTMSLNLWLMFLNTKPSTAPITVAMPTPKAVSNTRVILFSYKAAQSTDLSMLKRVIFREVFFTNSSLRILICPIVL